MQQLILKQTEVILKLKFIEQAVCMSYYDPFYPSLEATRLQIQRSFVALEQKLRMQRQIDLDLQNQQRLRRAQIPNLIYEDQLRYRQALLRNDNYYASIYDREYAERAKYARQQETNDLKYLSKIERLERERLNFNRQREKAYSTQDRYYLNSLQNRSPYKGISPDKYYDEDETLVKKYEDGTRARQFKQDMMNNRSKFNSAHKGIRQQKQGQLNRTPFQNLEPEPQFKKFSNQKLSNLNRNQFQKNQKPNYNISGQKQKYQGRINQQREKFRPNQPYENQENPRENNIKGNQDQQDNFQPRFGSKSYHESERVDSKKYPIKNQNAETFGFKQSSKKSSSKNKASLYSRGRSRSQKQLNLSRGKKKEGLSPYSSYLQPKSERSPFKGTIADKKRLVALERSRKLGAPQLNALQKIQKRLKLSSAIYKDSQFRNGKHEISHLFNTYDCEYRLRKQLKDKINNHPMVLKKHAMVVE